MNYQIETDFQGPGFVAVPNHVAQDVRLSPDALGVLVYMASLPHGWRLSPGDVQGRFGIGKDRWQRIARELRDAGAMRSEGLRGADGRVRGSVVRVRWPDAPAAVIDTESRKTRLPADEHREPEKPAAGKPATESRETRQTGRANPAPYKDQRKRRGARPAKAASVGKPDGLGGVTIEELGDFGRSCVREGKPLMLRGEMVEPESATGAALREALRQVERRA